MKANFIVPTAALRPYIKNFVVIESDEGAANRVLPDTSIVIAFRFKGAVNYNVDGVELNLPSTVVSGLRNSARVINYSLNSGAILVIFQEAAAAALLKAPAHELFNSSHALNNLISEQTLSQIEEQLTQATSNAGRIVLIEKFLLSQILNYTPDKLVLAAVQQIKQNRGYTKIKELADSLYISQDAFEKRFRRATGATPKQFSSIIRLRSLINEGKQTQNLSTLAFTAGYFDQPHFNKDFKLFTGQTPTDFFKSPLFW
jgi:AraC-like DNA-binding protein